MFAKIANIFVVLMLIGLSLAILSNSMTKPVGRDEQMYCTGAVLLAQGKMIYRDFSYASQLPYHPLLYATLFRILNTNHYLLVGRLVSVVCDILVMVCIVVVYRHIFRSFGNSGILLGLAGAVLYVFNPLVDYANGYAWNHDVVILCVVLSFWLFVSTDFQKKSKYWKIAAIGALLTLATCMRITTALVELLFFVVLLSQPAESAQQRLKTVLPFLIAEAIVLIWPVWVIAQAPRAFFLNLVEIPALYGQWLHKIGMVHNKYDLTRACLTRPGYFVLIALTICLGLMIVCLRRRLKITNGRNLLLAALLPLIFFIIALIPPTMWHQYLAMPVPFLVISLAYPLFYLRSSQFAVHCTLFIISYVLLGVFAVVAVASFPVVLYRTPVLLIPERWEPIELHKISKDIGQNLKTQNTKLILTLAPLLALEGGCDIYTELSCGAIIYRIADFMSAGDRALTHTVGQETLAELLEKSPPSAVVLGIERGRLAFLEAPLQAAIKPDWERKTYENGATVYFSR
ncbi:MAG: glycosyltransferase family protein [Planctomycetota bacterium]